MTCVHNVHLRDEFYHSQYKRLMNNQAYRTQRTPINSLIFAPFCANCKFDSRTHAYNTAKTVSLDVFYTPEQKKQYLAALKMLTSAQESELMALKIIDELNATKREEVKLHVEQAKAEPQSPRTPSQRKQELKAALKRYALGSPDSGTTENLLLVGLALWNGFS